MKESFADNPPRFNVDQKWRIVVPPTGTEKPHPVHEDHINVGGLGLFRSIYIGTKVAISNLNTIPPREIRFPAARDHCVMEKSSATYRSEPATARPKGLDRSLRGTTPLHPLFQLQRDIGNQAITQQRSFRKVQAIGDPTEKEADRVAEQVMGETTAMINLSASPGGLIQRQPARGAAAPPPLPACDISRCPPTHATTVPADIDRALGYVNQAITAVSAASLSDRTRRTVDWFFRGHSTATVNAIGTRLGCIRDALTDTKTTPRYACHPTYDALAYVSGVDVPICTDARVPVCLTDQYFPKGPRKRAETMIHECAHRVGMSLRARDLPDIYEWTARFRFMDTEEALRNADTFALFASSIVHGVPVSFLISAGAGGGAAWAGGERTWTATLHLDAELQHPIVSVFNPFLGLHFSALGMPEGTAASGSTPSPSLIYSLVGGVRIGEARPGAAGAPYLSLFGGPALAIGPGGVDLGAEAGVGLGYRWRWLDVSAGATVLHDPTREPDFRTWTNVGGVVRIALP